MIEQGRRLQSLLEIPEERVRWVHASIVDVPPGTSMSSISTAHCARRVPAAPSTRCSSREVARAGHPVTIVSVADCLKDFLPAGFRVVHDDGQVAIFSNQSSPPAAHAGCAAAAGGHP